MINNNPEGQHILDRFSALTKEERVAVLLESLPENVGHALNASFRAVREILEHGRETEIKTEGESAKFNYNHYESSVALDTDGITLIQHTRQLLVSFRHQMTAI